jgi:hypothetical protein
VPLGVFVLEPQRNGLADPGPQLRPVKPVVRRRERWQLGQRLGAGV